MHQRPAPRAQLRRRIRRVLNTPAWLWVNWKRNCDIKAVDEVLTRDGIRNDFFTETLNRINRYEADMFALER